MKNRKSKRSLAERFKDYHGDFVCSEWDVGEAVGEEVVEEVVFNEEVKTMLRYCAFCDKKVEVTPIEKDLHVNIDNLDVIYRGKELRCPCCGEIVYDDEISDANISAAHAAYKRMIR